MKKNYFLYSLLAVLMCMCSVKSFAHDIEVKNADGVTIYYSWRNDGTELAVSYFGVDGDEPSIGFYSGEVIIPESVEYGGKTYKVTGIYLCAFLYCGHLTSVTIPNTVTSIGERAFEGCGSLTSVTIPSSVTSIGRDAFDGTAWYNNQPNGLIYAGKVAYKYKGDMPENTSIIIEDGTVGIADYAFSSCSSLTSVTIPHSVTSIGNGAFNGTGWYNNQPDGLVYAGKVVYKYKGEMPANSHITINDGTQGIASFAFSGCKGMTSITIPNSVESIGSGAFTFCSGLTSVTIPNSVESIGNIAFDGCNGLISIKVESGNQNYDSRNNCNAIIEKSSNTLIAGCKNTIIPNNVTSIGGHAFDGCTGLTSITIPNKVEFIGGYAFDGCNGLASITIPDKVEFIGAYAFSGCKGLTSVVSEIENPFAIDNSVFNGISSNATLIVPKGTKAAYQATKGWNRFTNIVEAGEAEPEQPGQIHINDILYKVTGSGEVEVVSAENGVTSITIPSSVSYNNTVYKVSSIAKDAFETCEHLSAVIWEPEAQFNAKVNNPNFLLYVSDEKYASRSVKNVVVNGVAESIELTDAASGNDFYCPRAFSARNIVYSHNYQMETGIGDSRGWETIVLPFDVQKYTHATKGELESFTTWTQGSNKKPFWLFELTASGYKDVASIKANTPYIISMPNNQQYEQQYQIPGVVTFSASDVEVQKSDNLKPGSYQGRSLVPNYMNKDGGECLPLNVNNYYVTNPGKDISGSKFVRGLRAVHPFEAYMTTTDNTRSIDVMEGMTTTIRGIQMVKDGASVIKVYDTRGVLMKTATSIDDVWNGLKAGVYIVNGKKMVIK